MHLLWGVAITISDAFGFILQATHESEKRVLFCSEMRSFLTAISESPWKFLSPFSSVFSTDVVVQDEFF